MRERLVWWSFLLVTVAVAPCARSVRATQTDSVAHASAPPAATSCLERDVACEAREDATR